MCQFRTTQEHKYITTLTVKHEHEHSYSGLLINIDLRMCQDDVNKLVLLACYCIVQGSVASLQRKRSMKLDRRQGKTYVTLVNDTCTIYMFCTREWALYNTRQNKSDISYLKTSQAFDVPIHSGKPNTVG